MTRISTMKVMDPFALGIATAAGLRTGILAELTKGPLTVGELVERLKLDLRATRLLLDVLETQHLVVKDGDQLEAGDTLRALADRPGGYALSIGMWAHLEEFLRTGEPFIAMDQTAPERERAYRGVVAGLGTMFDGLAQSLAARLLVSPRTILDVGCGSGVWGLAIAERHPDAVITGLDFPGVLESFTARASATSLSSRARTMPGDMHEVELPTGAFDLVVIANVLRLETPARASRVIERIAKALAPGGSLVVIDALASGSPDADLDRSLYALHLGLRTRTGEVHSAATITKWCQAAGLSQVSPIPLPDPGSVGVLLATRS
jgi:SAM-dependent methyltransferase